MLFRSTHLYHGTRTQEGHRRFRHDEDRAEGAAVPPQGGEFGIGGGRARRGVFAWSCSLLVVQTVHHLPPWSGRWTGPGCVGLGSGCLSGWLRFCFKCYRVRFRSWRARLFPWLRLFSCPRRGAHLALATLFSSPPLTPLDTRVFSIRHHRKIDVNGLFTSSLSFAGNSPVFERCISQNHAEQAAAVPVLAPQPIARSFLPDWGEGQVGSRAARGDQEVAHGVAVCTPSSILINTMCICT